MELWLSTVNSSECTLMCFVAGVPGVKRSSGYNTKAASEDLAPLDRQMSVTFFVEAAVATEIARGRATPQPL